MYYLQEYKLNQIEHEQTPGIGGEALKLLSKTDKSQRTSMTYAYMMLIKLLNVSCSEVPLIWHMPYQSLL